MNQILSVNFSSCTDEAVKVAAIGGSVTVGHNVEVKETAWLYRVFDWINTTFPNPNHQFLNKAIPAVTSAYVAPCVTDLLPPDLDLIFLVSMISSGMLQCKTRLFSPFKISIIIIIAYHPRIVLLKSTFCWL